ATVPSSAKEYPWRWYPRGIHVNLAPCVNVRPPRQWIVGRGCGSASAEANLTKPHAARTKAVVSVKPQLLRAAYKGLWYAARYARNGSICTWPCLPGSLAQKHG